MRKLLTGRCQDIAACPLMLADLNALRSSICFKSLFVPGVCCPDNPYEGFTSPDQQEQLQIQVGTQTISA